LKTKSDDDRKIGEKLNKKVIIKAL